MGTHGLTFYFACCPSGHGAAYSEGFVTANFSGGFELAHGDVVAFLRCASGLYVPFDGLSVSVHVFEHFEVSASAIFLYDELYDDAAFDLVGLYFLGTFEVLCDVFL